MGLTEEQGIIINYGTKKGEDIEVFNPSNKKTTWFYKLNNLYVCNMQKSNNKNRYMLVSTVKEDNKFFNRSEIMWEN